jgi:hypothetical protein
MRGDRDGRGGRGSGHWRRRRFRRSVCLRGGRDGQDGRGGLEGWTISTENRVADLIERDSLRFWIEPEQRLGGFDFQAVSSIQTCGLNCRDRCGDENDGVEELHSGEGRGAGIIRARERETGRSIVKGKRFRGDALRPDPPVFIMYLPRSGKQRAWTAALKRDRRFPRHQWQFWISVWQAY